MIKYALLHVVYKAENCKLIVLSVQWDVCISLCHQVENHDLSVPNVN
jgi:hypothetical protein